jgi:hypothetical protein
MAISSLSSSGIDPTALSALYASGGLQGARSAQAPGGFEAALRSVDQGQGAQATRGTQSAERPDRPPPPREGQSVDATAQQVESFLAQAEAGTLTAQDQTEFVSALQSAGAATSGQLFDGAF